MIYIPKEFLASFQKETNYRKLLVDTDRDNEYITGFITYKDEKGTIKQEGVLNKWKREENPIVAFSNVSIYGFKILVNESNSSDNWSSFNRPLFDIEDPRGFVLQINSRNVIDIIKYCKISNGLIESKCLWAWNKKNNILVPENTDLYKEGIESFRLKNQKINFVNLSPGDKVRMQNGDEGIWYGAQYITENKPYGGYRSKYSTKVTIGAQKRKFLFLNYTAYMLQGAIGRLEIKTNFNVSEIIEKKHSIIEGSVSDMLNKHIKHNYYINKKNISLDYDLRDKTLLNGWKYDYMFLKNLYFSSKKIKDMEILKNKISQIFNIDSKEILIWDGETAIKIRTQELQNLVR